MSPSALTTPSRHSLSVAAPTLARALDNRVAAEFHRLDELSERLGYLLRVAALGSSRHGTRPTIAHHELIAPSTSSTKSQATTPACGIGDRRAHSLGRDRHRLIPKNPSAGTVSGAMHELLEPRYGWNCGLLLALSGDQAVVSADLSKNSAVERTYKVPTEEDIKWHTQ